jgi:hypothetical protein
MMKDWISVRQRAKEQDKRYIRFQFSKGRARMNA